MISSYIGNPLQYVQVWPWKLWEKFLVLGHKRKEQWMKAQTVKIRMTEYMSKQLASIEWKSEWGSNGWFLINIDFVN